ncbi:MAG: hypothetical protein RLZZ574_1623 [Cyanobacteriota bacterium]|jgi:hypothetical protein
MKSEDSRQNFEIDKVVLNQVNTRHSLPQEIWDKYCLQQNKP